MNGHLHGFPGVSLPLHPIRFIFNKEDGQLSGIPVHRKDAAQKEVLARGIGNPSVEQDAYQKEYESPHWITVWV